MKKSELIEKLSVIPGDPEVGIGYWDLSLRLSDIQESTAGGLYEPFIHLIFSNDPLESVEDQIVDCPENDYDWSEEKVITDPNGNNIRCYVLKKSGVIIGYMRKSQSDELLSYERAQSRNTRFRYFKMSDDADKLSIARMILGGDVWSSEDDGTEKYAPLFYTHDC